jgi:histidine triad (HIT) family protein
MPPATDTIFGKIIRREIPAHIVYETETVLAFKDIAPIAPIHIVIIPKLPLASIASALPEHGQLLGELLLAAAQIAREQGLEESGYRVVTNIGQNGGQTVFHLHLHLLGGRKMAWPPG